MSQARIVPVILVGGTGTRLWPLSRELQPKQFHKLIDRELSLFQQTALRVKDPELWAPPVVVSSGAHRFIVDAQLREIGVEPALHVVEPLGRNTGPAIAAAVVASGMKPHDLVLTLPTDHFVCDSGLFEANVCSAARAAQKGRIVLFGIEPDRPETGYGYVKSGAPYLRDEGVFEVLGFIEKPSSAAAQDLLRAGGWYWNAGIFLFRAGTLLDELASHAPGMLHAASEAVARATRNENQVWLDARSFAEAPAISIDYALIEKTTNRAIVPAAFAWSDLGNWREIWAFSDRAGAAAEKDSQGLVTAGDVFAIDSRNSYLRADSGLLAAIGVEDLVVVSSGDAVLVAPKSRSQDIGKLVEMLRGARRRETRNHLLTYRPWGHFLTLAEGPGYQVKILTLDPGKAISHQYHEHRAERWVVVEGEAEILVDGVVTRLRAHESAEIGRGARHRLSNPGSSRLKVIEVQSGEYLGEDDIVRLDA